MDLADDGLKHTGNMKIPYIKVVALLCISFPKCSVLLYSIPSQFTVPAVKLLGLVL